MSLINDIITDYSNRRKHFIGGFLCGLLLTVLFAAGAAAGMEFKDKSYGNKWDWSDFFSTVIGGILGNVVMFLLIWIVFL